MIMTLFQVGLGGAIGSVLRFTVGLAVSRATGTGFPLAVLPVNVIGSFVMGLIVVYTFQKDLTHWNPFLMAGLVGGFTTFSAFSLEAFTLYEKGEVAQALLYIGASVVLSILGLALGVWLGRSVWS